jgi:alkaline phosphatase D
MEERLIDRRQFLIAGAAAGVAAAAPLNYAAIARGKRLPLTHDGSFLHGVAAGQPTPGGIELWTRLSGIDRSALLTLEVAKDPGFSRVVRREVVRAPKRQDNTVHARVNGLYPAQQYYYRFHTRNHDSKVGKFRTLPPPDSNQTIRIGFFSCQDYEAGYYTTHAALANEPDLDLVLCLGDYIYEHKYYPGPAAREDHTGVNHDGDVQSLAEFRQKYHFYQADPNLQALHAAHPFVSVWDDHEVEDNYAGKTPDSASTSPETLENNNSYPRRVPFLQRRRNGYKAFFEAMPRQRFGPHIVFGSMRLGKQVELILTDQRRYRDPQPCNDALLTPCPDDEAPGRTMLGHFQKNWFKGTLASSKANWKLWGSEVMVMSLDTAVATPTTPGAHANPDQWDGYSAERKEILSYAIAKGVKNLVVLSGDIHTFIAGNVTTTGGITGQAAGTELVGGSVTSLGLSEFLGVPPATLEALRKAADPHTIYADFVKKGYCVVTVNSHELIGEFKAAATTQTPTSPTSTIARFRVANGVPKIQQI